MSDLALIIEDDEDLATIFSAALSAAGFDTQVLRDGLAARARLAESVPQVVVLDMHLPHVSGADLLAQIKQDERLAASAVIVTTADALMGDAVRETADFVLIKPISFTQLRALAQRLHTRTRPPD